MASFNRVMILGNLGQDPELKHTANQTAVCNLSVATTDYGKDKEGNKTEFTEWHRVICWSKTAENCAKYLAKGRSVMVEGRLQTRSWENKEGVKQYTTEIVAQNVQFLGSGESKGNSATKSDSAPAGRPEPSGGDMLDEIPFMRL